MLDLIASLISTCIALAAFIYGTVGLFAKKSPLYFRLIICACGCYLLEELSSLVTYLCGGFEGSVNVGIYAIFGCGLFLFSANFGQLDGLVNGGEAPVKVKCLSAVPSIILAVFDILIVIIWNDGSLVRAVTLGTAYIPMIFASYYNMKHLLMPVDELGFLSTTRWCNIFALVLYFTTHLFMISIVTGKSALYYSVLFMPSISILALVAAAERGNRAWKTLLSSY